MDNKKLTKKDYFNKIRKIVANDEELVAFIDKELELLAKKNSRSRVSVETQKENEKLTEMLLNELKKLNRPITITDLIASSKEIREYTYTDNKEQKTLSNQKISSIFKTLVDNGTLVKVVEKKRSYFSIA